jgi:hypothetical protein
VVRDAACVGIGLPVLVQPWVLMVTVVKLGADLPTWVQSGVDIDVGHTSPDRAD